MKGTEMKKLNKTLIAMTAAAAFTSLPVVANADTGATGDQSTMSKSANGCKSMVSSCGAKDMKKDASKCKHHKKAKKDKNSCKSQNNASM